jgi:predicted ester cyclase
MTSDRRTFAERYTAAWCSGEPGSVSDFFAPSGSLAVNDNPPAAGRSTITEVARSFMATFPDMRVLMDDLREKGDRTEYHWTLVGTSTGPGGIGQRVRISGYESWEIGDDGLIATSQGHFDAAEYERQLCEGI